MPTRIDQMVTDVTVEPEPAGHVEKEETRWDQADRLAHMLRHMKTLELRTRAEGFDD